jgi:large subunit ribosomal protein L23
MNMTTPLAPEKHELAAESKLHLVPHQIILRPLVTEKGVHRSNRHNAYAFEVNTMANKHDVRRAIEELFNVKVIRVHIQNRKGKPRRSRNQLGRTRDWKKAVVTLDSEHKINFF